MWGHSGNTYCSTTITGYLILALYFKITTGSLFHLANGYFY
uniref:Uncharacterized protein n=1 Tax=Rhizophora mucronata TaxID=61149 RepID=A0A2P2IJJ7_RHIMU